jgi:hypothetical protein
LNRCRSPASNVSTFSRICSDTARTRNLLDSRHVAATNDNAPGEHPFGISDAETMEMECDMPQVWLSYDELSEFMGCTPTDARRGVIENQWPRRHSSDGLTRVKLPPDTAHQYMLDYGTRFGTLPSTEDMVSALRGVLAIANRSHETPSQSAIAG